jgi:hypothetical protein
MNEKKMFNVGVTNHLGSSESQEPSCEIDMAYQDVCRFQNELLDDLAPH